MNHAENMVALEHQRRASWIGDAVVTPSICEFTVPPNRRRSDNASTAPCG
jgi:hypothetical protein